MNETFVSLHLLVRDRSYCGFGLAAVQSNHMGDDGDTWMGVVSRNRLPDLNTTGVLLLGLCGNTCLLMTNPV